MFLCLLSDLSSGSVAIPTPIYLPLRELQCHTSGGRPVGESSNRGNSEIGGIRRASGKEEKFGIEWGTLEKKNGNFKESREPCPNCNVFESQELFNKVFFSLPLIPN